MASTHSDTTSTRCSCPDAYASLEILGAPVFDDSTGGSNWCLKRCRLCGRLFDWEHEYTYLVNGASEDDTYVTPLDGAGAREALRKLFARLKARTHSTQEAPRTTRLPDTYEQGTLVPIDQPGVAYPQYPMMEGLRAREPIPDVELATLIAAHARFIERGGAGGGWRTALTSAEQGSTLVFAFYGCPDGASCEDQAQLQLARLPPSPGSRFELPSSDLLAVSCVRGDLDGANLAGSMLVLADLAGTSLRGATLSRADCTGARMAGCDLRDADLRGTDFDRANLTGADLRGARIDGASFLDTRTIDVRR